MSRGTTEGAPPASGGFVADLDALDAELAAMTWRVRAQLFETLTSLHADGDEGETTVARETLVAVEQVLR